MSYNIIKLILHYHFKNLSLMSDSIQSIYQVINYHHTCPYDHTLHYPPYNQTLHYHFIKIITPLVDSIQSIIQLQSDWTDSILSFQYIYITLVLTIRLYTIPIQSDSTYIPEIISLYHSKWLSGEFIHWWFLFVAQRLRPWSHTQYNIF